MRARGQSIAAISPQDVIRLMNQGALLIDLRGRSNSRPATSSGRA